MFFLDSSNPDEIKELFSWGVLAGVTTHEPPHLCRDAGRVGSQSGASTRCSRRRRGPCRSS